VTQKNVSGLLARVDTGSDVLAQFCLCSVINKSSLMQPPELRRWYPIVAVISFGRDKLSLFLQSGRQGQLNAISKLRGCR
jgi:hypothetical protein